MAYNYVLCTEIIKVRFLAGDYLRGVSLQTSGVTTTSACLAGSIPVLSTHFFVFLIVSGKLYHCDRVKAGSDSPGIH